MKNKGHGKAEILDNIEFEKICQAFNSKHHKLIWQILRYTGERIGAIIQLKVSDVYSDSSNSCPLREITFRAGTRKATADGTQTTRQVPISRALGNELSNYSPPDFGWLFPSPRDRDKHLVRQSYDEAFRTALVKAGLNRRGFSLHSPRRTLITRLSQANFPLATIRAIIGHKSIQTLQEYIEVTPAETAQILESI